MVAKFELLCRFADPWGSTSAGEEEALNNKYRADGVLLPSDVRHKEQIKIIFKAGPGNGRISIGEQLTAECF